MLVYCCPKSLDETFAIFQVWLKVIALTPFVPRLDHHKRRFVFERLYFWKQTVNKVPESLRSAPAEEIASHSAARGVIPTAQYLRWYALPVRIAAQICPYIIHIRHYLRGKVQFQQQPSQPSPHAFTYEGVIHEDSRETYALQLFHLVVIECTRKEVESLLSDAICQ